MQFKALKKILLRIKNVKIIINMQIYANYFIKICILRKLYQIKIQSLIKWKKEYKFVRFQFKLYYLFQVIMASSCYFGYGRKPGVQGNSTYLMITEDISDNAPINPVAGQIKQMDKVCNKV